jgi:hypothetical protein
LYVAFPVAGIAASSEGLPKDIAPATLLVAETVASQ